jgi:hypothetical protein
MMTSYTLTGIPSHALIIIQEWLQGIQSICPQCIEGVYLTGSIPLKDFQIHKSDIDFIVLLSALPDQRMEIALGRMHRLIQKKYPKPDLSGIYLSGDIRSSDHPELQDVLTFHEGKFGYQPFEMSPVTLYELKENALTLYGVPSSELQFQMDHFTLNNFLHANINSYWKKWVNGHSSWFSKKLLLYLFPRFTEWSILGIGRQLYTLETGKITSKTEAGNYLLARLPPEYHSIVQQALDIRKDTRTYPFVRSYAIRPSWKRYSHTITCLHYLQDAFNVLYRSKNKLS